MFQTLPNIAPSIGRGEMKVAVRYLPQIIHSEGVHTKLCLYINISQNPTHSEDMVLFLQLLYFLISTSQD